MSTSLIGLVQSDSTFLESVGTLRWIDTAGLCLVLVFVFLGMLRGLWWQVFRLIVLVAAIAVARAATPELVPAVADRLGDLDPRIAHGLVWGGLFVAVLAVGALVGRLGKKSIEVMQLSLLDRLGGALAGGLTGAVLHVAVIVGVENFTSESFAQSVLDGTVSYAAYEVVVPELSSTLAQERDED